jgi:hypothetical protein
MGWDKHYGYQLYQSDPSGNYGGWKVIHHLSASQVSGLSFVFKMRNFFVNMLHILTSVADP